MKFRILKEEGFTLIEMLLYVAIVALAVGSFVAFSIAVVNSRNKNYVAQEVQANARNALDIISQKIRTATGVNVASSSFGLDPGVLSLAMTDSAQNPAIIDLDQNDGVLRVKEGLSSPVAITSDEVRVVNLVFTNLTPVGGREHIKIDLTISFPNPSGDVEFNYSQSLQTSVSVRQ